MRTSIRVLLSLLSAFLYVTLNLAMASVDDDNDLTVCESPSPTLAPFVDELTFPSFISLADHQNQLTLSAFKITQRLHRDLPNTTLYAFGTSPQTASFPGPTLLARVGEPAEVRWDNAIEDEEHMLGTDNAIPWADPPHGGVPVVVHLHGAQTQSSSDGHPDAWFTFRLLDTGPTFLSHSYTYPNLHRPSLLWYHDHTHGITRLNLFSGLMGMYLLLHPNTSLLPSSHFTLSSSSSLLPHRSVFPNQEAEQERAVAADLELRSPWKKRKIEGDDGGAGDVAAHLEESSFIFTKEEQLEKEERVMAMSAVVADLEQNPWRKQGIEESKDKTEAGSGQGRAGNGHGHTMEVDGEEEAPISMREEELPMGLPLLIRDWRFSENGSLSFPLYGTVGNTTRWCAEYGDLMVVNGVITPYLRVRPALYRFRLLNACNARVLELSLTHPSLTFLQIGSDGGTFLPHIFLNLTTVLFSPGERLDFLIDFSNLEEGAEIVLLNTGPAPFPIGKLAYSTNGTFYVMKFVVDATQGIADGVVADGNSRIRNMRRKGQARSLSQVRSTASGRKRRPRAAAIATAAERAESRFRSDAGSRTKSGTAAEAGVTVARAAAKPDGRPQERRKRGSKAKNRGEPKSSEEERRKQKEKKGSGPNLAEASSGVVEEMMIEGRRVENVTVRRFTMRSFQGKHGEPNHLVLNNKSWTEPVTDFPKVGSWEVWELINLGSDAHNMHIHLVSFRVLNTQAFSWVEYEEERCAYDVPYPDESSCFTEEPIVPDAYGVGWKDTVLAWPGNVTRLLIRFAADEDVLREHGHGQGGGFPFDATTDPGYLWHCHTGDHEDYEMMRPFSLVRA